MVVLFEREAELAAGAALVEAVSRGSGRVLWVEGPAGIGKTRLLETTRQRAQASGLRTLAARCAELEREFSFGVARSLFEPVLAAANEGERAELLAGAAALAAPVITLTEPDHRNGTAERLHGLFWLTANLADTGPLLLSVDDAHWADEPSLRMLAYLARRMGDLAVGVLVAARPGAGEGAAGLMAAIREEPITTVLRPGPLGRRSSDALVRARFAAAAEEFCASCHEASGGNPLLLGALVDALGAAGTSPDRDGAAAVRERAPAILATSVLPRLRRLPPVAAAVARAGAVLGNDAELRHVAALAGLAPDEAAEAADALVEAGLLAPGRPLSFAHPLVAAVVADHMSAAELHRGHHLAARRLADEGADPERVAGHLLATDRLADQWVVCELRRAARTAIGKGAPAAAVSYLRRALVEPPDPDVRHDVEVTLGAAQVEITVADGLATLNAALGEASDPDTRARIALTASRASRSASDFHTASRFLGAVQPDLDGLDAELRYEIESEFVCVGWVDPAQRVAMVRRARELEPVADERSAAGANVLVTLAFDALHAGAAGADRAAGLAVRAARLTEQLDRPVLGIIAAALTVLIPLDRLDVARAVTDRAIEDARRRGSLMLLGETANFRSIVNYRCGRLVDAEADIRLAHRAMLELDASAARRWTVAGLIRCLVERGELAEAVQTLEVNAVPANQSVLLEARGHLRAAQGRPQEALDDFLAAGERAGRQISHPGLVEWRPAAALALAALGRLDEARGMVREAVRDAADYSADRALGLALRAQGLVDSAVPTLADAVEVLAATPARLEHARTLVDLGAALRRANRRTEARERLADGMSRAQRCGATALVARAREELAAAGARPRRTALTGIDALTPSERRVAQLAADGLGNREVAQALFVTTKTVETHLAAAYRKLGITGRPELPAALG